MSPKFLFAAIFGTLIISAVHSANILAFFTCLSPSHLIIEISMAKVLAENGHNVTVVTTLKPHVTHKNLNIIHLALEKEELKLWKKKIADMANSDNSNTIASMFRMRGQLQFTFDKNVEVMSDPRVIDFYENKDNKFDLVMIGYFLNNFQMGIAQKLKVPVIIASSMFQWEIFNNMLGNPRELSYVPRLDFHTEKGRPMNFKERLKNVVMTAFVRYWTYLIDQDNAQAYK